MKSIYISEKKKEKTLAPLKKDKYIQRKICKVAGL